jgi:hypothetical protein
MLRFLSRNVVNKAIDEVGIPDQGERRDQSWSESSAFNSTAPEIDQKYDEKRSQNQRRDHNNFDPQLAHRWNVVVDSRISVKEAVAISKHIHAREDVDDEKECRCYS